MVGTCGLAVQVAELYEDLKTRVSQFNMKVPDDAQPLDYTSKHRLKFIIQVRASTDPSGMGTISSLYKCWLSVLGGHCWCLLSQLLCSSRHLWRPGLQRVERLRSQNYSDGMILEFFDSVLYWLSFLLCKDHHSMYLRSWVAEGFNPQLTHFTTTEYTKAL